MAVCHVNILFFFCFAITPEGFVILVIVQYILKKTVIVIVAARIRRVSIQQRTTGKDKQGKDKDTVYADYIEFLK